MNAIIPIIVAVLNAVGPSIVEWLSKAFSHPDLNDNGKAALKALGVTLHADADEIDRVQPLPVPPAPTDTIPEPPPTAPGRG